jgi:hypothetical protein
MGQVRDINTLHPELQAIVKAMQTRFLEIGVHETIRTEAYQNTLFAQGRTVPGNIVTNACGQDFDSMHQWGVAFDFHHRRTGFKDLAFFREVGAFGKSLGLAWGGDFKSIVDMPHFELRKWGASSSAMRQKYKKPETFFATWPPRSNITPVKSEPSALVQNIPKQANPEKMSQLLPLNDIAREVIRGNWGNNPERARRLTAAGYDAAVVQRRVNEMLRG